MLKASFRCCNYREGSYEGTERRSEESEVASNKPKVDTRILYDLRARTRVGRLQPLRSQLGIGERLTHARKDSPQGNHNTPDLRKGSLGLPKANHLNVIYAHSVTGGLLTREMVNRAERHLFHLLSEIQNWNS